MTIPRQHIYYLISALCLLSAMVAHATGPDDSEPDAMTDVRLNPEMDSISANSIADNINVLSYSFINQAANYIHLNGANPDALRNLVNADTLFNIVHIGDSHIQADVATAVVRKHLQQQFGDGGRGLVVPFRLAGTNQPLDYKLRASSTGASAMLMRTPWHIPMGFTGIAVTLSPITECLYVSANQPFSIINVFANGPTLITAVHDSDGKAIQYTTYPDDSGAKILLSQSTTSCNINISGGKTILYGLDLRRGVYDTGKHNPKQANGIVYHTIGNNGATYGSYNRVPEFAAGVALLNPNLIIVSLGANEAFGKISNESFRQSIATLVNSLKHENPNAQIILTTPAECQRKVVTRRRGRRGRRGRRVTSYQVNANCLRLRNVILQYGKDNHLPVYDFYAVAGGQGSSTKWLNAGLLSRDRIHRTFAGYHLEGQLLTIALENVLHK